MFVHDRETGITELVSVDSSGNQGNADSGGYVPPSIAADGRFVAFKSFATNLVPGDTNGGCDNSGYGVANNNCPDIFVHDRQTGNTERVSVDSAGNQAQCPVEHAYGDCNDGLAISATGRFVAFVSHATNLVSGDTNATKDVFIHDRWAGSTDRVSLDSWDTQANAYSWGPIGVTPDGGSIAFTSRATNLVIDDTNDAHDVFVRSYIATSVGGVAEHPDVTALPLAAASGRDYSGYILGAAVAFAVTAVGATGWRRRRRRA